MTLFASDLKSGTMRASNKNDYKGSEYEKRVPHFITGSLQLHDVQQLRRFYPLC
jgi:hypothetical protein